MALRMGDAIASASIAIVGTLVGAVVGVLTNVALDRFQRQREARAATRLVEMDLHSAEIRLTRWIRTFPNAPGADPLRSSYPEAWTDRRDLLAAALDSAEWRAVSEVYRCLEDLRLRAAGAGWQDVPHGDLVRVHAQVLAGATVLRRYEWSPGRRFLARCVRAARDETA